MKTLLVLFFSTVFFVVSLQPQTAKFFEEPKVYALSAEKTTTDSTPVLASHTEALTASPAAVTEVVAVDPGVNVLISTTPILDNETITWNKLISEGYTREQTAGIMGNLQQEHGFKTSDVAGGLGIAQWINGRSDNLRARGDYLNIHVQLQYLIDELNTGYTDARDTIKASGLEGATIAFQNKFERCGVCREGTRIQYAYNILARH